MDSGAKEVDPEAKLSRAKMLFALNVTRVDTSSMNALSWCVISARRKATLHQHVPLTTPRIVLMLQMMARIRCRRKRKYHVIGRKGSQSQNMLQPWPSHGWT